MKHRCGNGREDNISLEKGGKTAALLVLSLLTVGMLSISLPVLSGDVPIEGPENIRWGKNESPIYVFEDVIIGLGQTLTIEPGVTIYLENDVGLFIYGTLSAIGTADEPILLTGKPNPSYPLAQWRSIVFARSENSVLNHVMIERASKGLFIVSSSPHVENSQILSDLGPAVTVNSRLGAMSHPVFINCSLNARYPYFYFDIYGDSIVTAINTFYDEARTRLGDLESVLERQWFLDVQVENSLGEAVEGSYVSVVDNENGSANLVQATNAAGISSFVVTGYTTHFGYYSENKTYYTPHTVSVSKQGYTSMTLGPLWIGDSRIVNVTLDDTYPPITTLIVSGTSYGTNPMFINELTLLSFRVSEDGTKPIQTWYDMDGGGLIHYIGESIPIVGEGLHNISFYSSDPAENCEPVKHKLIHLDTRPPTLSFDISSQWEGINPMTVPKGGVIALEATDEGSGVSAIRFSMEEGFYQEYSSPILLSEEGFYNISYNAEDRVGNSAEEHLWARVVSPIPPHVNNPPFIISVPIEYAKVGETYHYQSEALDPDYDELTYSLEIFPKGMTIDAGTGSVTWTPTRDQAGKTRVAVSVSDGKDIDTQSFFIYVEAEETTSSNHLLIIYGTMGIITALGVSFVGLTEYGRFRFFLFFLVPLYSKLRKDQVLNQFLRGQIYGYIMAYPGENYSSIKKALNVSNGTLTHHLYILEREGYVVSRVDRRYKRFYPAGYGIKKRAPYKMSMVQRAILKMIRQNPNINQIEIAEALETSKQVVNYHMRILEKYGMVTIVRNGSELEYQALTKGREQ